MTDTKELKSVLVKAGLTIGQLAEKIGLSRTSLSYKINNIREFTASEIDAICETLNLNLTEKQKIFFKKQVD